MLMKGILEGEEDEQVQWTHKLKRVLSCGFFCWFFLFDFL